MADWCGVQTQRLSSMVTDEGVGHGWLVWCAGHRGSVPWSLPVSTAEKAAQWTLLTQGQGGVDSAPRDFPIY